MSKLESIWETYVSAWKLTSKAAQRERLGGCLAADCVYTDPLTVARGVEALLEYMAAFHEQVPGGHFVTVQFFSHHERCAARWKMVNATGEPLDEGVSYGEYDETGRLKRMTGFFNPPPSPAGM